MNGQETRKWFFKYQYESVRIVNPVTSITLTSADVNSVYFGQNALTANWAELEKICNRKKWSKFHALLSGGKNFEKNNFENKWYLLVRKKFVFYNFFWHSDYRNCEKYLFFCFKKVTREIEKIDFRWAGQETDHRSLISLGLILTPCSIVL